MRKTIRGIEYEEEGNGVLVPVMLVREAVAKIRKPEDIFALLQAERFEPQECFVVFTLDACNQVIKKHVVTKGLANQSQIHPRETYRPAIADNSTAIMVAHNHPSGNLEASVNDLLATRRLAEAGKVLGIPLLDHLIVSATGFVSLRERFPDYFNPQK